MPNMTHGKWRFWLDRGGTFIDIVAVSPQGHMTIKKTLSENTDGGLQRCVRFIAAAQSAHTRIPSRGNSHRHNHRHQRLTGTERGKNGTGGHRGFADALIIGNQTRPRLFELDIRRTSPLVGANC